MHDDDNRSLFVLEKDDRMLLILTTTDTLKQPGPKTPLWHMEFDRNHPVQDAVLWVGEREHLWPEWQRIAETRGRDAIDAHIERIWETQPIERADTLLVSKHADNLGIDLLVTLTSHRANVVSHRFASEPECRVFDEWLTGDGAEAKIWQLVEFGCLQGSTELHRLVDALTCELIDAHHARLDSRDSGSIGPSG
ncbi:MAG: hypothetical protein V4472_17500 [Pseudomonadota bacterium]